MPAPRYLTALLSLLAFGAALAQAPQTTPSLASKAPFNAMLGTWKGSGWASQGPNKRVTFNQTEVLSAKADGNVITVEGTGSDPKTGKVTFTAFAVAAFDNDGKVTWTAYSGGYAATQVLRTTKNSFTWFIDVEGGQVRYTSRAVGNKWTDTGVFSADGGKTWFPTFEMTLTKVE